MSLNDHTALVALGFQQSPPSGLLHPLVHISCSSGSLWGYVS